jgi:hypothetical protein
MKIQLQVDGRKLIYPIYFRLPGPGTSLVPDAGWNSNSTLEILTYTFDTSLPPGQGGPAEYSLCIGDDVTSTLAMTVFANGTIAMSIASAPYFTLTQTSPSLWTLDLIGYPLTLDARYLSTSSGLFFVNQILSNAPNLPWRFFTGNFLPGGDGGYLFEVGSGLTNWQVGFNVDVNGNLTYTKSLDISEGGPLKGAGGKVLEFLGFPVLIDARAATAESFYVSGFVSSNDPNSDPSVQYLNLLPFEYGFNSINGAAGPVFTVGLTGEVTATGTPEYAVSIDTFRGMTRLSLFRRLEVKPPLSEPIHAEMAMSR